MSKENILISRCLLGERCRYDGKTKEYPQIKHLEERYNLIGICPECEGGLGIPRPPSEVFGEKVLNSIGENVTLYFRAGAEKALEKAKRYNCKKAVLKEKSPSCGSHKIYDGTFSKTLVNGEGVTVKLLKEYGIEVFSENEADKL